MGYAAHMITRSLPLFAGIAPIVGVSCAYWLGVRYDVLPSCMPLIDGCTSISATGRNMPGRIVFRSVMFPQSALLIVVWCLAARWLRDMTQSRNAATAITISGCIGALALVVYVATLGTKTPLYDFMRRFGVYFYFLGTAVAQLTLAISLLAHAKRTMTISLKRIATGMLWLCALPFALGFLNLALKAVLDDPDFTENRIEWISALLMQFYFVVLYVAWRDTGASVRAGTP